MKIPIVSLSSLLKCTQQLHACMSGGERDRDRQIRSTRLIFPMQAGGKAAQLVPVISLSLTSLCFPLYPSGLGPHGPSQEIQVRCSKVRSQVKACVQDISNSRQQGAELSTRLQQYKGHLSL